MSFVVITPETQAEINAIVEAARKHCIPWSLIAPVALPPEKHTVTLADRKAGPPRPQSQHIMLGNVEAAFSFEEQPAGICRHLSVAVARPGKLPSPEEVAMIAEAFGFTSFPPIDGNVWVEEFEPGHHAVNVVEVSEPCEGSTTLQ
jgi:hypothetical protein